ncbi:MAG: RNA 2'-phosphotransferase [Pedobacter sp.]
MSKLSKYLSRILRHTPDQIGIRLDSQGWTDIDELLRASKLHGIPVSRDEVEKIAALGTDKRRFEIIGNMIRATHGHSVEVDLGIPETPPALLFHASPTRNLDGIFREGLQPGKRKYVHLSESPGTAQKVAARHGGNGILLEVAAAEMYEAGFDFYQGLDGVWLVSSVPPENLKITTSETCSKL